MIGLTFEPVPGRRLPDIRGTLWLDSASSELRLLEFRYATLPRSARSTHAGGEVWFAKLPTGQWIVRRWFIRMPQFADIVPIEDAARNVRGVTRRTAQIYRFIEEGGSVFVDGVRFFTFPASISGAVLDSSGVPLRRGHVELGGSPFAMSLDSLGRYHFDSIPEGPYTVVARTPDYSLLGVVASDSALNLAEGARYHLPLRTKSTSELRQALCGEQEVAKKRSVLRIMFRDLTGNYPLSRTPVHGYWVGSQRQWDFARGAPKRYEGDQPGIQGMTDSTGAMNFCGVPGGLEVNLRVLLPTLEPGPIVARCTIGENVVAVRLVEAAHPASNARKRFETDSLSMRLGTDSTSQAARCRPPN